MPLDPAAAAYLEEMASSRGPAVEDLSPPRARAEMDGGTALLGPPQDVAAAMDRAIPGPGGEIAIRIFTPIGAGPFPALVYFHGGGWVLGSVASHDGLCRMLANATGCVVVSVDYRLAPEHPYPAAVDDAFAATQWVSANAAALGADASRLAVAGDSAGGNLATVAALMARDRGGPAIAAQVLLYPITDCDFDTPSYTECAEGYMLTRRAMIWFWDHYLPAEAERSQPYAAPLRAEDLGRLPPALVITAEYDPLRDEGEAYAERLREAGNAVTLSRYDGMIHGFIRRPNLFAQASTALEQIAASLRQAFAH